MADQKITELNEATTATADDVIAIVDSPASGAETKKITIGNLALAMYPVGSIYISVDSTNPGTLFGGTWAAFGAGKTLVSYSSGDSDFGTAEGTGGNKTHSHSGTFTSGNENADHGHNLKGYGATLAAGSTGWRFGSGGSQWATGITSGITANHQHGVTVSFGSGTANSTLQPFIVTYMFKRTA
jgi:hypothetical protein